MLGRASYDSPWLLSRVDCALWGDPEPAFTRTEIVREMASYLGRIQKEEPLAVRTAANHIMGIAQGLPGARLWRRSLTDPASWKTLPARELILRAWSRVSDQG